MIRTASAIALTLVLSTWSPALAVVPAEVLSKTEMLFIAEVAQPAATTMSDIPKGTPTIVVRVERVIEKPAAVALRTGDRVTIAVADPAANAVGRKYAFYAAGWIFGRTLAVREVAHEVSPAPTLAADGKQLIHEAKLRQAIVSADAVVVGNVIGVGPAADAAAGARPLSEHDPEWRDAVVVVEESMKGLRQGQRIVVRFPSSSDVAWYRVPKLQRGEHGLFLLHRDPRPQNGAGTDGMEHFILRFPADVQLSTAAPDVRRLARLTS
jgi:hypothetical protein